MQEGATLARWSPGAVLWGFLLRQKTLGERRVGERSGDAVEAAACRLPRWQRGLAWTRARAGVVSGAPPRRSSPPTSSEQAGCQGAARAAGAQCRLRRRAQEAAALARRPPPPLRTRHPPPRRAGHGPAQGPPGGLGAQPVARYVPFLPPLASGSRSLARRGLGSSCQERDAVSLQGQTLATLGDVSPPGTGSNLAAQPSSAKEGGSRKRLGAGSLVCLGRVEEARVEKR